MDEYTTTTSVLIVDQCQCLIQIWEKITYALVFTGQDTTLRQALRGARSVLNSDQATVNNARNQLAQISANLLIAEIEYQKMELLFILDEQVELLAKEERPDLARFFDSPELHSITPSKEVSSLLAEYGLEREPVLQGCLDATIDRVVKEIGHVLGKYPLGKDDFIIVNGAIELSCGMFDKLRSKEWLNCWDIAAALEMTNRLVFMRLGLSIPLHKKDANGKVIPLSNPLRR